MTLKINPVLCRKGVMDNYAYIITDTKTNTTAVIDASETEPVIAECAALGVKPSYVLSTHHHFDHVGGNAELKNKFGLKIGASEIDAAKMDLYDFTFADGDVFELGKTKLDIIATPGHTTGHVLFYAPEDAVLFTGDVLFNLSIGGLFEGTPQQMFDTLQKIKLLPDDVLFYPGHEYTKHGLNDLLRFNDSQPMQIYAGLVLPRLKQGLPAAPVKLGLEKQCNPYLMIDSQEDFENLFM